MPFRLINNPLAQVGWAPPYKFIRVNWNCRGIWVYWSHTRAVRPKNILITSDWGEGVTASPGSHKERGHGALWWIGSTCQSDHPLCGWGPTGGEFPALLLRRGLYSCCLPTPLLTHLDWPSIHLPIPSSECHPALSPLQLYSALQFCFQTCCYRSYLKETRGLRICKQSLERSCVGQGWWLIGRSWEIKNLVAISSGPALSP